MIDHFELCCQFKEPIAILISVMLKTNDNPSAMLSLVQKTEIIRHSSLSANIKPTTLPSD
jgi:hypothetical protein